MAIPGNGDPEWAQCLLHGEGEVAEDNVLTGCSGESEVLADSAPKTPEDAAETQSSTAAGDAAPDVPFSDEDDEPYYRETPREHVYTTRSGRAIITPARLVLSLPQDARDAIDLKKYDDEHGSDCEDGLSEPSQEESETDTSAVEDMSESEVDEAFEADEDDL